jgi:hypothetical protein
MGWSMAFDLEPLLISQEQLSVIVAVPHSKAKLPKPTGLFESTPVSRFQG